MTSLIKDLEVSNTFTAVTETGHGKMRILHLLNDVTDRGSGIVNTAVDLACAQAKAGHIVAVASAGGGYEHLLEARGVQHLELIQRGQGGPILKNLRTNLKAFAQAVTSLRSLVRSFDPDIVHCHMITGTILGRICRGKHRYRLVAHVHNVHQGSSAFMRLADRSIAVSDAVAVQMRRWGFAKERIAVVRNGTLGTSRLSQSSTHRAQLEQPAIVTVAGLWQRKNIDGLIEAFDDVAGEFPGAHLYIVGDGMRGYYEDLASKKQSGDRIHFEGFQLDPRPYMRAARIFVLASHREAFGLVLQEAREAGAAIIGTDVDGIPEALDYGRAGILIPPGDRKALADAMRLLLSDEKAWQKWRAAAQENLQQQTVLHMNSEIEALYQAVLPGKAG